MSFPGCGLMVVNKIYTLNRILSGHLNLWRNGNGLSICSELINLVNGGSIAVGNYWLFNYNNIISVQSGLNLQGWKMF